MVMDGPKIRDSQLLEEIDRLDVTIGKASAELDVLEETSPDSHLIGKLRESIAVATMDRAVAALRFVFGPIEEVGEWDSPAPVDHDREPSFGPDLDAQVEYPGNVLLDGVPLAHASLFEDVDANG